MIALDATHPEFQHELGYVPCRAEECEIIECHARHEVEAIAALPLHPARGGDLTEWRREQMRQLGQRVGVANAARARAAKIERQVREAPARLAALGIVPKHVHTTEGGAVLAIEWTCPQCDGKGWKQSPACACRFCFGRGSIDLTYAARLALAGRMR